MIHIYKKYLAVLKVSFLNAVEYRTEFFISVLGWGVRLSIGLFLWAAVAKTNGQIGDYTFPQILQYFFIIQIISSFIFSRVAFDINEDIQSGDFSNYLVKPIAYLPFRMVDEMSSNFFRTILATVIFGSLLIFLQPGFFVEAFSSPLTIILFVIALGLGYMVNFCIVSLIAIMAFWIVNSRRFTYIYFGILTIFSGIVLPLDLFPASIFRIFQFLPFSYIFYFPAKILQTVSTGTWALEHVILPQLAFISILSPVLIFFYSLGVKKYEAVGR